MNIKEGEIFGLLGPNGAGKTTTMNMLCTILNPTSGYAKIGGYDVFKEREEVRRSIGIVFQDPCIDNFLTGRENLAFHAAMYHMKKREREDRISEVLDLLDLKGKENVKIDDCPAGVQRRFEVARGFMNHPKVLFLDEPTIGLDIVARRKLWEYIRKLNDSEGMTIILTTHYIEEADYLCDRVAVIDNGRIKVIDTPDNLKNSIGEDVISLEIENGRGKEFLNVLTGLDWIEKVEAYNNSFELSVSGGDERVPELVNLADKNGFTISSIDSHKPTLEDTFIHYVGKTIRESEGSMKEERKARRARRRGRR